MMKMMVVTITAIVLGEIASNVEDKQKVCGLQKARSPKTTATLVKTSCFYIAISQLAIPSFFWFTDGTEFMMAITILYR